MRYMKTLAALGLSLALPGAAAAADAQLSSTWTLASDYDYRGNSQTAKDPAVQASLDFSAGNGWYIGAWASNVDFGPVDVDYELDLYTGYTWGSQNGPTYDVGLLQYVYPDESDFNFLEVYGSVAWPWFKGKLSYSQDFAGDSTPGDTAAFYADASATVPLPRDFSLLLHAGLSTGDYWDEIAGDDVLDYSLGVGYAFRDFNLALKYVDTETDAVVSGDVFNNEGRVIFMVSTTFAPGG